MNWVFDLYTYWGFDWEDQRTICPECSYRFYTDDSKKIWDCPTCGHSWFNPKAMEEAKYQGA